MKARADDSDLFTASQLALATGISRTEFFRSKPRPIKRARRSYGTVPVFAVKNLPEELRGRLHMARMKSGCKSFQEFVRSRLQMRRRATVHSLLLQRLAPSARAFKIREVFAVYFRSLDCGKTQIDSNRRARAEWIKRFGRNFDERQIRRIAAKIDDAGGPELAPIDAYGTGKSLPRARSGGGKYHREAVTTASRRRRVHKGVRAQ